MMGYYTSYGWNGWMLMVMIVWPLVLAAAIWAVVAITRRSEPGQAPEDILKQRFASGDISEQEFVESRAILRGGSGGSVQRS